MGCGNLRRAASWGIACYQGKDVRYDCNRAIQKNGFAAQVSRVSGKLTEGGRKKERGLEEDRKRQREVKKNNAVMGNHWLFLLYEEAE